MAGPPGTPLNAALSYSSDTALTLTWDPPAAGKAPVNHYVVTTPRVDVDAGQLAACGSDPTVRTCTFTGLSTSDIYTFQVGAAGDVNGVVSAGTAAAGPMRAGEFGPPGKPSVQLDTATSATVSWDPPPFGSPTSYVVKATGLADCTTSSTSCEVTGLASNQPYTFTVTATRALFDDQVSAPSDPVVSAMPMTPTAVTPVLGDAPGKATVTWTQPAGGGDVSYYTVTATGSTTGAVSPACAAGPAARSCSFTGLTTNQTYTFTVTAFGDLGSVTSSVSGALLADQPGTPLAATAALGSTPGQAVVTWNTPATGGVVTSYTVTASSTDGGALPSVCTVTLPATKSCTFSNLPLTNNYRFVVSAINAAGHAEAPLTAATVYNKPLATTKPTVALSATPGTATVSWTAGAGGTATGYTVTPTPALTTSPATCTSATTSCTFTNLNPTTAYTFVVTATNASGSSDSVASDSTVASAPTAPTLVTVTLNATPGNLTVGWSAPSGGGAPTSYTVTASSTDGGTLPIVCTVTLPAGSLACPYTGLDLTKHYAFSVTAINAAGHTEAATTTSVVPDKPGAPLTPVVTLGTTAGTATVTWTAPASGGAPSSYTVTPTSSNSGTLPATCTLTVLTTLSCSFTNLDVTKLYGFTVSAINGSGHTEAAATTEVTPAVPNAPTLVSAALVAATPGSMTVTWSPPIGGGTVTSYTVTASSTDTTNIPSVCTKIVPAALTCTFSSLSLTGHYAFTVSAINGAGHAEATTTAAVVPDKPGAPTAVAVTLSPTVTGTATVSWGVPAGGGAVTGYTVTPSPSTSLTPMSCSVSAATRSCDFAGLDTTTSYTFVVAAVGVAGSTTATSGAVVANKPGAPGTPTATVTDSGTVTVTWTAPTTGGPVADYTVTPTPPAPTSNNNVNSNFCIPDPITFVPVCSNINITPTPAACLHVTGSLTCTFTGLSPTTSYTFVVSANGNVGSTSSAASSAVTPGAPGIPVLSAAVNSGANAAKLTWTAPSAGGPVTSYTVWSYPRVETPASCLRTTALTCIYDHLIGGQSYTFRVRATGPGGTSEFSASSGTVVAGPPDAPGKPAVTVTAGSGEVRVSWDAPAAGAGIDGYTVRSDTGGFTCASTSTWCVVQGLDLSTPHQFRVQAVGSSTSGSSAFSPWSDPIVAGDGSGPNQPDMPVAAVAGLGQVVVKWTAPTGGAVTRYAVTASPRIPDVAMGCADTATVVPCVFTGLDPQETYRFTVTAYGPGGTNESEPSMPATPGAPAIPGNAVAVSLQPGTASISWVPASPLAGGGPVTSYSVTSDPYVPDFGNCTRTTSTSCVFTGLQTAGKYTFLVTANGPAGSTAAAVRSEAVVPDQPAAPGQPIVQVNPEGTATVKWAAPDTGGTVVQYVVTATTVEPNPTSITWGDCAQIRAVTCVFAGLDSTKSYTFVVRAVGTTDHADSPPSPAITTGAPGVIAPPVVRLAGPNAVRVTWAAPGTGGPVDSYSVRSTPEVYPSAACTKVAVFTCIYDHLASGVQYTFAVRATGVANGSQTSLPSAGIVPGPPDAPGKPTITSTAPGQILVSWAEPAAGAGIRSYTVVSSPSGLTCDTANLLSVNTVISMPTSCPISGVDLGAYRFRVQAVGVSGSGSSAFSPWSDPTITVSAPTAPTNVTAIAGNQQVAVSWTASASGSVSSYRATANPGGQFCVPSTVSTACTITGLTNGIAYTVSVVAVGSNNTGTSAPGVTATSVRPTAGAPGSPTGVIATPGDGTAAVSWSAPVSLGDGVASYLASAGPNGPSCTASEGGLSCTIVGLTNGTSYPVTVVAVGVNNAGTSAPSTPAVTVQPIAPTAAVTSVTVTPGASNLTVRFVPPANVANVASFTATAAAGPTGSSCTTISASSTACVIAGVTPGTTYSVTVVANLIGGGRSPASVARSVTATTFAAPALPAAQPTGTLIAGSLTSSVSGSLPLGSSPTITGTAFAAFSGITVGFYPAGGTAAVVMATATTDANGQFSIPVPITGIAPGAYTIVAAGARSASSVRYKSLAVQVVTNVG